MELTSIDGLPGYRMDSEIRDFLPGTKHIIEKPNGKEYKLSITSKGKVRCSCRGFKFYQKCRHSSFVSYFVPKAEEKRLALHRAISIAEGGILALLEPVVERVEVAGSIRRKKETVKDGDIVCVGDPVEIARHLESIGLDFTVKSLSIIRGVHHGFPIDIRITKEKSFGATMLYFTGSKEFNIRMRAEAKRKGWKLNEYGLFDSVGRRLASRTEEEIFEALGREFISPEMRV